MTTFAMRGNKETRLHGNYSLKPVEIMGSFHISGPQPVSAVPELVVRIFEANSEVTQVAINTESRGMIYQRMDKPSA